MKAPIIIGASMATIKLAFLKPAKVSVVGSYLLHTLTKPMLNVDVAVTMPSSLLQVGASFLAFTDVSACPPPHSFFFWFARVATF